VHVGGKVSELETTYFDVVREWGQSIESADSYTFGHCERVAQSALAIARGLALDETPRRDPPWRLSPCLGKVRVPHEILNKPGPLTREEFEVVQLHPDLGPRVARRRRVPLGLEAHHPLHHERYDGTGYPDRLRGDEIPVAATNRRIVDVYDALTTARSYRPAMSHESAMLEIEKCRGWCRAAVYNAFLNSRVATPLPDTRAPSSRAVTIKHRKTSILRRDERERVALLMNELRRRQMPRTTQLRRMQRNGV